MTPEDLQERFSAHKGNPVPFERMRDACLALAEYINNAVPDCREKSTAITKLEEVMFWANAALARHPKPAGPPGVG